jgi:hypothetical protein
VRRVLVASWRVAPSREGEKCTLKKGIKRREKKKKLRRIEHLNQRTRKPESRISRKKLTF